LFCQFSFWIFLIICVHKFICKKILKTIFFNKNIVFIATQLLFWYCQAFTEILCFSVFEPHRVIACRLNLLTGNWIWSLLGFDRYLLWSRLVLYIYFTSLYWCCYWHIVTTNNLKYTAATKNKSLVTLNCCCSIHINYNDVIEK